MRRSIKYLACLAVASGLLGSLSVSYASSPASLNLKLSDLPKGFIIAFQHVYTNNEAAKLDRTTVANMVRHGRITSEERLFRAKLPINGYFFVDASVSEYRSPSGAEWIYNGNKSQVRLIRKPGHRAFVPMSVGQLGDERSGYTVTYDLGSFRYTDDIIAFRRGRYFMDMEIIGVSPTFKPAAAIHIAHILDNRVRKYG